MFARRIWLSETCCRWSIQSAFVILHGLYGIYGAVLARAQQSDNEQAVCHIVSTFWEVVQVFDLYSYRFLVARKLRRLSLHSRSSSPSRYLTTFSDAELENLRRDGLQAAVRRSLQRCSKASLNVNRGVTALCRDVLLRPARILVELTPPRKLLPTRAIKN